MSPVCFTKIITKQTKEPQNLVASKVYYLVQVETIELNSWHQRQYPNPIPLE